MGDIPFGNRLLIVDDEPSIREFVRRVAENVGFEVVATEDPALFIRTARQWRPTIIMLDLHMPGTDGIQLLRALAADKCGAYIALSSGAHGKILETAQQLGRERGLNMGEILEKPILIETLREFLLQFNPIPKDALLSDLARGISEGNQLFLEFQPKLDCRLGRITAVEALVRWQHPMQGILPPDQFIPLAEETDLIHGLTDWVVLTAAKQVAAWRAENLDLHMAVNISARDIEDIELPERLSQHCAEAGIDPATMILELTETGAMRQAVQMMDVLTRLRLKGFRLSIDDFGTGYSSLVELQRLPFSELKIDRSFVMQMTRHKGSRVIVEIIVSLAQQLGLQSAAEGVEDEAALACLREIGCDMAQGYHVSRPIAPDQIVEFVRRFKSAKLKSVA